MLRNYLKIAWRNLRKNKIFSAINIFGLSVGLACCILMFLFLQHELSYDMFNKNAPRIYRVTSVMEGPNGKTNLAVTPAPWAPLMAKDYPEIATYTRLLKDEKVLIGQPGGQTFYETQMLYADSTFFDVFSIELEKGDIKTALERPNSIVLTPATARKYFGDADPLGKTLAVSTFGRNLTLEVTAIAKPAPANSHFSFSSLVSMQSLGDLSELWSFHMFQTYLLLNANAQPRQLQAKFPDFVNKYIINNPNADGKQDIYLQPLASIHLHSHMTGEIGVNGDITYIYIFAGVAIFILLIACFNFTNLSTARSLARAKEVGLRKVVGAGRQQLLRQFLGETTFFALLALLVATGLAYLALPLFNKISARPLVLDLYSNYQLMLVMAALLLSVGLLAGLYPAAVLSAFKPVEVLKGKFSKSGKGLSFRKFLVTLQFAVSIGLIAATMIVNSQMNFLRNKNLGFNKENVAVITLSRTIDSARLETFRSALLADGVVKNIAAASTLPGTTIPVNLVNDGSTDLTKAISMQMLFTDLDFAGTMKMELVAGRDFTKDMATDKTAGFLVNEQAVKKLGWKDPQDAIGKTIQWVQPTRVLKTGRVIGVVKDFHITPLTAAVQPLVMHYAPTRFQYLYLRFDQPDAQAVIASVEKKFRELFAKQSFEYTFLDDTLNAMYTSEQRLATIFNYCSVLAILIACLGVLGLSLYTIQQRVKEIGIRKVLGAGVMSITTELLKEFVKPVFIAAIIATPITWHAMNMWLENFAYRTSINWTVFVVTTAIVLLLAVLTMAVQSVKAALNNPVQTLRTE
ncbi:MAG TPA: ABC transporter permease [Chitinophagaceae bacterium]|nr:ABC transporter permease [Chitinophagaceae bacterium]